jgi:hypothetical protein
MLRCFAVLTLKASQAIAQGKRRAALGFRDEERYVAPNGIA